MMEMKVPICASLLTLGVTLFLSLGQSHVSRLEVIHM